MNFYQKRKIREYLKKNIGVIIGTSVFLIIGLVVMLVGFAMTGWSFIEWLKTPYATTFLIMIIFFFAGLLVLYYLWRKIKDWK